MATESKHTWVTGGCGFTRCLYCGVYAMGPHADKPCDIPAPKEEK